jgi:threonylcarbamoyladenosine tRNA methylthiotransferase MtaB
MTRVYAAFVGCKVSQADKEAAAAALAGLGHAVVTDRDLADVGIVMSCAVTAEAERKSRQLARRLASGGRRVIVAGCAAALRPSQFLDGSIEVLGDRSWGEAVPAVSDARGASPAAGGHGSSAATGAHDSPAAPALPTAQAGPRARTRLNLKVQDGCAAHCTFCTVRLARGPRRSLPLAEAVAAARTGLTAGCGEVVLTGIDLGSYNGATASGTADLADLIGALTVLPALRRLRLSSIEPRYLDGRLLDACTDSRVARHLHIPLQSGDDGVLAAMGRPYTFSGYAARLEKVRRRLPGVMISTDVIVGFPTEDDRAFGRTLAAIGSTAGYYGRVHVFAYSPRPGTEAAALSSLPAAEVRRRMAAALAAARSTQAAAHRRALGAPAQVLIEERRDGLLRGYSSQYTRYYLEGTAAPGELVTAVATECFKDGVKGRIA